MPLVASVSQDARPLPDGGAGRPGEGDPTNHESDMFQAFTAMRRVRASALTSTQRLVLLAFILRSDSVGDCWAAITTIGDDTGLSERAVRNAVRELERLSILKPTVEAGRSTTWHIEVESITERPRHVVPTERHDVPPTPAPSSKPAAPRAGKGERRAPDKKPNDLPIDQAQDQTGLFDGEPKPVQPAKKDTKVDDFPEVLRTLITKHFPKGPSAADLRGVPALLKQGHTVEEMIKVYRHCAGREWLCGKNPGNVMYIRDGTPWRKSKFVEYLSAAEAQGEAPPRSDDYYANLHPDDPQRAKIEAAKQAADKPYEPDPELGW